MEKSLQQFKPIYRNHLYSAPGYTHTHSIRLIHNIFSSHSPCQSTVAVWFENQVPPSSIVNTANFSFKEQSSLAPNSYFLFWLTDCLFVGSSLSWLKFFVQIYSFILFVFRCFFPLFISVIRLIFLKVLFSFLSYSSIVFPSFSLSFIQSFHSSSVFLWSIFLIIHTFFLFFINYKWKRTFHSQNILMGKMDLVSTDEIPNIRLKVCEFEPQITTFFIQSASLIA